MVSADLGCSEVCAEDVPAVYDDRQMTGALLDSGTAYTSPHEVYCREVKTVVRNH